MGRARGRTGVRYCEGMSEGIFALMAELIHGGISDGSIRAVVRAQELTILLWVQITGVWNDRAKTKSEKPLGCPPEN